MNKSFYSPLLSFYLIANIIEKKYKIKTKEFLNKIGLSKDKDINVNDFLNLICQNLKVDEITSIILFKGLDYKKTGLINLEDFMLVIDSYRDDTCEDSFIPEKIYITNQNKKSINVEKKEIDYFRNIIETNLISVEEIFIKINKTNTVYAYHLDLYNKIKELLRDNINDTFLKKIIGFLEIDEKIFRNDFENLLVFNLDFKGKDILKFNFSINLNDVQIYWINKLISLLETIGVTPLSAFNVAIQDKVSKDRISIDTLKKKLKIIIPGGKVTTQDLNNIADSLDINKTRIITIQEFNEMISISQNQKQSLQNNNSKYQNNSFLKESKSVNMNLLPYKGNYKVLSELKAMISKNYKSLIDSNKNTVYLKNESFFKENTNTTNQIQLEKVQFKEEKFKNSIEISSKQEQEQKISKVDTTSPNFFMEIIETGLNSFINDLEDLEEGEWKLIEIFEEQLKYENITGYITTYNIFRELKNTFFPKIPTATLFQVVKGFDENKDGYISIKEITKLLLKYFKHKSTKLSLKEVSRKIEFYYNISTEDFFENKSMKMNSEIDFKSFSKFFIYHFGIEPTIAKKIYGELKYLKSKQSILVADVIDLINEYRSDYKNKSFNRIIANSLFEEYSGIEALDKKSFETEIRSFVNCLINIFGHNLKEKLTECLKLPKRMNLKIFREGFVDKLNMNLALGISIFKLLKNFSHKDEQIVSNDDLFMFLESYISPNQEEQNNQIELMISNLESIGCPLKYPLENLKYNSNGMISNYIRLCYNS